MIKIASYNIHKCVGRDGVFNPSRIVDVLAEIKADVVALQEADVRFGERRGLLDLKELHAKCGLVPMALPRSAKSHGWRGNVILYRQGVVTNAHQLILPGVEPRGAIVADISVKNIHLRIIATHFGLLRRSRAKQVETVLKSAEPLDKRTVVLMGDLNEWRLGRRSALVGLEPIFGPIDQFIPSYPSPYPILALDRILCTPRHSLVDVMAHNSELARIASDHLPISAQLRQEA